jgi:hypothetical protein
MQMDRAQRFSLRATAHAKLGNAEQALEDYDRAIRTHGELFWIHALRPLPFSRRGSKKARSLHLMMQSIWNPITRFS